MSEKARTAAQLTKRQDHTDLVDQSQKLDVVVAAVVRRHLPHPYQENWEQWKIYADVINESTRDVQNTFAYPKANGLSGMAAFTAPARTNTASHESTEASDDKTSLYTYIHTKISIELATETAQILTRGRGRDRERDGDREREGERERESTCWSWRHWSRQHLRGLNAHIAQPN